MMIDGIAAGVIIFGVISIAVYIGLIAAIFMINANTKKLTEQLEEVKKQNKELVRLLDINNSLTARKINEIQNRN